MIQERFMLDQHPSLKAYLEKIQKDNIRFLVAAVGWNILMAAIPMTIGIIALSRILLPDHGQKSEVVKQLSRAFQGVLGPHYLDRVVNLSVQHSGWLLAFTLLAALWGAWNIGLALSDAFDAMFEVNERPFLKEKLIDLSMFFVLLALVYAIVSITSANGDISQTVRDAGLPHLVALIVITLLSLCCAFVLFTVLYMVYPNTRMSYRLRNVWHGALLAAILFQLLTYIWPLYEAHFAKYGGLLFPFLVLVLWVYFFSLIAVIGAEVVALTVLHEARQTGEEVGPAPDGSVPEHRTLAPGRQAG
jgi:YihY family inner membrane protein